jgi:hypothetical protein
MKITRNRISILYESWAAQLFSLVMSTYTHTSKSYSTQFALISSKHFIALQLPT